MAKKGTTAETPEQVVAALAADGEAVGWTVETGDGYFGMDEGVCVTEPGDARHVYVVFRRTEADVTATVALNVRERSRKWSEYGGTFRGSVVEGHVFVNGRCFTRRGIDISSVVLRDDAEPRGSGSHEYGDISSLLWAEFARCRAAEERRRSSLPVPGTPFSRQPEWFTETAKTLKTGRSVTLMPHGFGTGYVLSCRRSRFDKRAPAELEQRLGVGAVYISTFDAD